MSEIIKVPNIGDFENVEIIEILVKNGDNKNLVYSGIITPCYMGLGLVLVTTQ